MAYQKVIEIGLDGKRVMVNFNQKCDRTSLEQLMYDALRIMISRHAILAQREKDKGTGIISPNNGKRILKP